MKGLAGNLALLALSTAIAVSGAELVLRRHFPEGGLVYRLDPRCHYSLAPRTRKQFRHDRRNGGGRVLITVNSKGFRGDELREDPAFRIVVYGDSLIEAEFATLPETFARRLEARLAEGGHSGVEVVNAGVNGYGPDQALLRFQDEVGWLQPDLVVFSIFADNDFGDVLRNRLFRLDGDGRLVRGDGVLSPALRRHFAEGEGQSPFHLLRGIKRLFRGPRLAAAAREAKLPQKLAVYLGKAMKGCLTEYEDVVQRRSPVVTNIFEDHYDADVSFTPLAPSAQHKRALLAAMLGRIREATSAAGIPALVMVVPAAIDVCADYDVRVDKAAFTEYAPDRLSTEAESAARQRGLPVINLFRPFQEADADRLYYRHGNDHWNADGQDLAARLVARRIVAEGWLRGRPDR